VKIPVRDADDAAIQSQIRYALAGFETDVGRGFNDGSISIEVLKLFRFTTERIFVCDLESPAGRVALASLTRGTRPESIEATALGAFVSFVRTCRSVADVRTRCVALVSM